MRLFPRAAFVLVRLHFVLALALTGCSFTISSTPTRYADHELGCASRALPMIDTTMAGLGAATTGAVVIAGSRSKDSPGFGPILMLSIALLIPTTAYAIGGARGFGKVARCHRAMETETAKRLGGQT